MNKSQKCLTYISKRVVNRWCLFTASIEWFSTNGASCINHSLLLLTSFRSATNGKCRVSATWLANPLLYGLRIVLVEFAKLPIRTHIIGQYPPRTHFEKGIAFFGESAHLANCKKWQREKDLRRARSETRVGLWSNLMTFESTATMLWRRTWPHRRTLPKALETKIGFKRSRYFLWYNIKKKNNKIRNRQKMLIVMGFCRLWW